MSILTVDLGGTKLALALLSEEGILSSRKVVQLNGKTGTEAGSLIKGEIIEYISKNRNLTGIGIAVPGIYSVSNGTVWAPNIPGWESYPLLQEIRAVAWEIPVIIDSDRACYIAGEVGFGNAKGCNDAIFISVGTGIGAGIIANGKILRGAHDIAGAVGWMALKPPFENKYISCGCFEYHSSGSGVPKMAMEKLDQMSEYDGKLKKVSKEQLTAYDLFDAFENGDELARELFKECIQFWGMAVANFVSIFDPEKIIFGGGMFGPATRFLPEIYKEAKKWAQPISMQHVKIEVSSLGGDAGLYGAGYLASKKIQ